MQVMLVAMLFFMLLVTVFALQNAVAVPIQIFFWNFRASLALVIIGSAFAGALFSLTLRVFGMNRSHKQSKEAAAPPAPAPASDTIAQNDGREASDPANLAD